MKKTIIYFLVCTTMLFGFQTYAQETGDINNDGNMSLADVVLALKVLVFPDDLNGLNLDTEVNNDTKIGLEEAIYILLKLYADFPPSCIENLDNWKTDFRPGNSDCMKCHTTCTPSHTFCDEGEAWDATETKCLKCHRSVHN
ncbi:hypothetical protein QUF80_20975 [Desulfococcaceae bacterium HSG8]|nr:hypothetical protein [Desulfococcaceae bacterium HSG8]